MNKHTYLYEVTFCKDKENHYRYIRASDKVDAVFQITKTYGDVSIVSISLVGN